MHGMSRARTRELEPQAACLDAGSPEALGEQRTVEACHAQCSADAFAEWSVQASSGSELGGYRRFLGRSSESHRPARPRNLVVLRFAPIVACSRTQGGASTEGRPEPIACQGDRTENDARLSAPKERISHLTHDAWNSIVTTTDHLRTTTLNIRRRKSGEPTSTSQHQDNRPH